MKPKMRREDELILACSCFDIPLKQKIKIDQLLSSQLDWNYICQHTVKHNVANLVYRSIKNSSVNIDPDISQLFHNIVLQNTARSLFQTGFLLKLLALLEKKSIVSIPFKGPALSQILYNDPAVRSYGDLDILIQVDDISNATSILIEQGFIPEITLSKTALSAYVLTEDNIIFHHPDSNLIIELHWEISGQYLRHSVGFDFAKKNIQEIEIAGRKIQSLSIEDLLFYLCVHGNKHIWSRLEWLCCVAELIKSHDDLNWEKVYDRAKEFQCIRMVSLALALVSDLLNARLPDYVMKKIHDDETIRLLQSTVQKNLFPEDQEMIPETRFSKFHLQSRDSAQDRLRYCCRLLFQPTFQEWHTWPLPGQFSFLYYIFRPFRLCWKFFKKK